MPLMQQRHPERNPVKQSQMNYQRNTNEIDFNPEDLMDSFGLQHVGVETGRTKTSLIQSLASGSVRRSQYLDDDSSWANSRI